MKELSRYINESLDEYYHFTNVGNLVNICKDDSFVTSADDYHNGNYKYFMSMSRQRHAYTGYAQAMIDSKIVRIVLDGRKLNSKYKIESIDFTQNKNYPIRSTWADKKAFDDNFTTIMLQSQEENEDRLYTNDEEIKQFHKYIKEIQVDISTLSQDVINTLDEYSEKFNVNIEYLTSRQFMLGRR